MFQNRPVSSVPWRRIAVMVVALCLMSAVAVQAQTPAGAWPWQVSLQKTSHQPGASQIFVDLPMPPPGRLLTLERISILVGPTLSIYGKVFRCEVQSASPKLEGGIPMLESKTRAILSLPTGMGQGTKTWGIVNEPVRVYAQQPGTVLHTLFRVVCDVDAIAASDAVLVTAVGYTTPINNQ